MAHPKVIVVEDYKPLQTTYKALLDPEFEVVGVLDDASRLLSQITETQAEIVVLDVSLPGKRGFQVAREIRELFPHVHLIFLTTHPSLEYIREALAIGASGYVSKVYATPDLPAAVRAALAGKQFISPSLQKRPRQL